LTHTFLVLVAVGLGQGVYRKLCTWIGGQRAEKFENHWRRLCCSRLTSLRGQTGDFYSTLLCIFCSAKSLVFHRCNFFCWTCKRCKHL